MNRATLPRPPSRHPATSAAPSGNYPLAPALLISSLSLLALGAAWQDRAAREYAARPTPTHAPAAHATLRSAAQALHQSLSRSANNQGKDMHWTSTLDRLTERHPGAILRQAQEDIPAHTTNPLPESRLHLTLHLPHELHLLPLLETVRSASPLAITRSCRLTRNSAPEGGLLAMCTLAQAYLPASAAP